MSQWFLFGILFMVGLAACEQVDQNNQFYQMQKLQQSYPNYKRIETINRIAKMVDLTKPNTEYRQSYGLIWFLACIYFVAGICFCIGCFGFVIKKYNDYKVYIKELNYMNNRV